MLSDCGRYRYALEREWCPVPGSAARTVLFVLHNPSVADAELDDPTLRRCIGFARDHGCSRLLLCNLFALRSTDPAVLAHADDPVGPESDGWLHWCAGEADLIFAGWGALARRHHERAAAVRGLLAAHAPLHCLGRTRDGHPRHPLYLPRAAQLVELGS